MPLAAIHSIENIIIHTITITIATFQHQPPTSTMNINPAAVNAIAMDAAIAQLVPHLPQLADDAAAAAAAANDDAAVAAEVAALVADAAAGDVDSNFVVLGYHITGIPNAASDNDNMRRHARAFYEALIPIFEAAADTFQVISREKHTRMTEALLRVKDGEALSTLRHEFPRIHKWNKSFSVIVSGSSRVLVARPKDSVGVDVDNDTVFRVTFLERVFADLLVGHGTDHMRGRTLYSRMAGVITNCPRKVCKLFTDLCPRCIEQHERSRSTAGLRPIITDGFGVRGQVDLIDFQSMPDGEFRFLLNYVDHGIKYLLVYQLFASVLLALHLLCFRFSP